MRLHPVFSLARTGRRFPKTILQSILTPLVYVGIISCAGSSAAAVSAPPDFNSQSQSHSYSQDSAAAVPENLSCEWRHDPVGSVSPNPPFGWTLRAGKPDARDITITGYRILVASSLKLLASNTGDVWDSGKAISPNMFGIRYEGGPLTSHTSYYWKVRTWDGAQLPSEWSVPAQFTMGLLQPQDWIAHWIAATPDSSSLASEGSPSLSKPLPIFRKEFVLRKQIAQALIFVSGLGQYEARIDGQNITEAVLTPGWTDYKKRVLYDTYDITQLLHSGNNTIGVMLGNGMYNVEPAKERYAKFTGSFGQPKLILQIYVRYSDGSETTIISDDTWKTAPGPILFSSTYGGEDYDARREQEGWDKAGFNDSMWSQALQVNGPDGELTSEQIPLIHLSHTYKPATVTEPKPGISVYDLGQNFAGWPDVTVSGAKGSWIKLIAGELLDANGLVTQNSASGSPQSQNFFTYILKGSGVEQWHPRFSYYGFRYVQVERSQSGNPPTLHSLTGQSLHDDVAIDGSFTTSDQLFDRIHRLIDGAILNNMVSILTDCPHREKLGWLEQTHLAASSIMYNYDVARLYMKISDDMMDAQLPDGMVPSIAPEYVAFVDHNGKSNAFRDSPEWGSAVILSPWAAYTFYGDLDNLRSHYPAMQHYANYLGTRARDNMVAYGLGDWYDIGPKFPGESQLTSPGLTATAIYYQDLKALSRIASLLDKPQDAAAYALKANAVKESFNEHLFHPATNEYDRGSQTANAMPLVLGLVPQGHREAVLANLIDDIRKHTNHVTAGDIGFHYLVRALTDSGRSDVLYDMLSRTDTPSYGYQLSRGATTLTEAWDANPDVSQDHFMLGHAEEWFYRGLAGIKFDLTRSSDQRIRIQPTPVGNIRTASASYKSILGRIDSSWSRTDDVLQMDVTIPPGTTATVLFPETFSRSIQVDGIPLSTGPGIHAVHREHDRVECIVGSGRYHFEAGVDNVIKPEGMIQQ